MSQCAEADTNCEDKKQQELICEQFKDDDSSDDEVEVEAIAVECNLDEEQGIMSNSTDNTKYIALDYEEWDTIKNSSGMVTGSKKIGIIQFGYLGSEGIVKALILQVHRYNKLQKRLIAIFEDERLTYVGVSVGGDINKIGNHFKVQDVTRKIKRINLGIYARKRGLIKNGIIGLDALVKICLNENLEKKQMFA